MNGRSNRSLKALFEPASIVVIGASDDLDKTGGRAFDYLERFGFAGEIFAVNKNRDRVQGRVSYSSALDLPGAPDLAIVAVPGEAAVEAVRECAELGVGAAIVTSSGFAETGETGVELEQRLRDLGRAHGIRIVGPNSQGIANFASSNVASFSSLFLTYPPADGPVAVVSQSGSMSVVPYCLLREQGIGVRYCIATGNEADVTVGECAEYVLNDPEVKLVLLYLESVSDAEHLRRAGELARQRGVPVIALKAGRHDQSQHVALSHTGAIANEDRVVSAFLARHGIFRAVDVDELMRASSLYLAGYWPAGDRLLAVTDSGATAVMLVDTARQLGLEVQTLPTRAQVRLSAILPGFAATRNPIDMTSVLRASPQMFANVLEVLGEDDHADMMVIGFPASGEGYDVDALATMAAEFAGRWGKPVVVSVPQTPIAKHFRDAGLATYSSDTDALLALLQMRVHHQLLTTPAEPPAVQPFPVLPSSTSVLLPEDQALDYLEACGFPVAAAQVCTDLRQALDAYAELGPDVVLKGLVDGVAHKHQLGLVVLDVCSASQMEREYRQLTQTMSTHGDVHDRVLMMSQFDVGLELAIGLKHDPVFGAVLLLGEGGSAIERSDQQVLLMAPAHPSDISRALEQLPMIVRWRGQCADAESALQAYIQLAHQVSMLGHQASSQLVAMDMNPVALGRDGGCVRILDVLIEVAG